MSKASGHLYAIGAQGTPWVKIGCTTGSVEKRLKTLQTGQPFPLQVLAAVHVQTRLQRIERQVHAFLAAQQRRGEWFEIPMDLPALQALITRAIVEIIAKEKEQQAEEARRQLVLLPIDETFSARLQRLRNAKDLKQDALAKVAGIRKSHISMLESGQRKGEQLAVGAALALADVLGVSVEYLIRGKDRPRPRRRQEEA